MKELIKHITWNNVNASNEQIKGYVNNYAKDFNVHVTNLVIDNGNVSFTTYDKVSYEDLVVRLIRQRYQNRDEYKLHREAIINGINDEFTTYNAYVEECKVRAKAFIEERNKALEV